MDDWRLKFLLFRMDTYLVVLLGIMFMLSVSKWSPLQGKKGETTELIYSIVWPLSFPFWAGFVEAYGIIASPFIALAFGTGFALGALRRTDSRRMRIAAGMALAVNLLFLLFPATIAWTTRFS